MFSVEFGNDGLMVEILDLKGVFQPQQFYDSMFLRRGLNIVLVSIYYMGCIPIVLDTILIIKSHREVCINTF